MMQKIIILICLIFLLCFSINAEEKKNATVQESTLYGVITENGIRVRSDKNTSSKVIGNLYNGEKVTIFERSKEKEKIQKMEAYWYKIDYKGEKGWVYGYYFIAEEPIENLQAKVKENNVRLRKEFGLGTEVIGKVFKDDKFKVVTKTNKPIDVEGKKDFWYKVVLPDNTYGWLFGEFLELSTSTNNANAEKK